MTHCDICEKSKGKCKRQSFPHYNLMICEDCIKKYSIRGV